MAFNTCHRVFLLALAMVASFWVAFVYGGHQPKFNDWHYDYRIVSYGLNRPEKLDSLGKIPAKFESSRGDRTLFIPQADGLAYR